jgi:hypothetical protein
LTRTITSVSLVVRLISASRIVFSVMAFVIT